MPDVVVSPRMKWVLKRAADIGKLHTGKPFVGTENVLRALVEDQDGIAATVLRELGVTERIADRLDEIMITDSYRTSSTFPNE
jgi:ATP-dependent Clp protease ATP-binding subunit ClpA